MATKMLVCPECASAVGRGRFACTSCGALLASVTNGPRSLGWIDAMAAPDETVLHGVDFAAIIATIGDTAHEPEPAPTVDPVAVAVAPEVPEVAAEPEVAVAEAEPESAVADVEPEIAAAYDVAVEPAPEAGPELEFLPNGGWDSISTAAVSVAATVVDVGAETAPVDQVAANPEADDPDVGGTSDETLAAPAAFVEMPIWTTGGEPAEAILPAPTTEPRWPETRQWPPPGAVLPTPVAEHQERPRAGAYLPPSAVLTSIEELHEAPIAGPTERADSAAPGSPDERDKVAPDGATLASRMLPGLDPVLPSRVIVIGAGIAGFGFLLPWAAIVIGTGRIGGYLDQWGLAGPGHLVLLLVIVALAALASQVERLPDWLRPGVPAVILAGLLVGLVWPYMFGGLESTVGVYVTLTGGIVLVLGGLLDLWAARHAAASRAV